MYSSHKTNDNNDDKPNRNLNVTLNEELALSFISLLNIRSVPFLGYDMLLDLFFYFIT